MSASGMPVSAAMFSNKAILSRIIAIFSGSANWARKAASDAEVVSMPSCARFSRRVGRSPARAAKNALAAPTMPPPIMRTSPDGVPTRRLVKPEGSRPITLRLEKQTETLRVSGFLFDRVEIRLRQFSVVRRPGVRHPPQVGAGERLGQRVAGIEPGSQCFVRAQAQLAAVEAAVKDKTVEMLVEVLFQQIANVIDGNQAHGGYVQARFLAHLFDRHLGGRITHVRPARRKQPVVARALDEQEFVVGIKDDRADADLGRDIARDAGLDLAAPAFIQRLRERGIGRERVPRGCHLRGEFEDFFIALAVIDRRRKGETRLRDCAKAERPEIDHFIQHRHKDDYSRVEFARQSFEARPSRCYNLKRDEAKAMAAQPNPDGGAPAGAGERPIHEPVWHYR